MILIHDRFEIVKPLHFSKKSSVQFLKKLKTQKRDLVLVFIVRESKFN